MCAAVPVRALLQLPLLGVNRGYKGLYGGGWPLRGMGAAGTALGAADARTNEHYEIGTILTQKSQGARLDGGDDCRVDALRGQECLLLVARSRRDGWILHEGGGLHTQ